MKYVITFAKKDTAGIEKYRDVISEAAKIMHVNWVGKIKEGERVVRICEAGYQL